MLSALDDAKVPAVTEPVKVAVSLPNNPIILGVPEIDAEVLASYVLFDADNPLKVTGAAVITPFEPEIDVAASA